MAGGVVNEYNSMCVFASSSSSPSSHLHSYVLLFLPPTPGARASEERTNSSNSNSNSSSSSSSSAAGRYFEWVAWAGVRPTVHDWVAWAGEGPRPRPKYVRIEGHEAHSRPREDNLHTPGTMLAIPDGWKVQLEVSVHWVCRVCYYINQGKVLTHCSLCGRRNHFHVQKMTRYVLR